MMPEYAFKVVGTVDGNRNVTQLQQPSDESNHPVLKQLKDQIAQLEHENKQLLDTLAGVQEIVDLHWNSLPDEYQKAMNDRFNNN